MRTVNYEVAKCQICKSDDYEILYIEDYAYHGDFIIVLAKARCCNCGAEFWVKEYFHFDESKKCIKCLRRTCVRFCPGRLVKKLTTEKHKKT